MDISSLEIIELPSEAGAGTRGASLGPSALMAQNQAEESQLLEPYPWISSKESNDLINKVDRTQSALQKDLVLSALESAYAVCSERLKANRDLLILSGDHSNAAAGVASFTDHYGAGESAVIWVDAHADLHTPFTTPSGNMHGMPLAAMLGLDNVANARNQPKEEVLGTWERIKKLGNGSTPKVIAQNLVFIGIRDLEEQEWELLDTLNIRYFTPKDIQERGIESILIEVEEYLEHIAHWYTSFDVDSLDPSISVGTGTPVPNGLSKEEAHTCFGYFFEHEKTKVFEITEINPLLDTTNNMAKFVMEMLQAVLR